MFEQHANISSYQTRMTVVKTRATLNASHYHGSIKTEHKVTHTYLGEMAPKLIFIKFGMRVIIVNIGPVWQLKCSGFGNLLQLWLQQLKQMFRSTGWEMKTIIQHIFPVLQNKIKIMAKWYSLLIQFKLMLSLAIKQLILDKPD